MAWINLVLLTGSVFAVSFGGVTSSLPEAGATLVLAMAGLALFVHRESSGSVRLLPFGATRITAPLGANYTSMALLLLGVTTEIFVPYFMQTLHQVGPLYAGYLSALVSGGWTIGSMLTTAISTSRVRSVLTLGAMILCGSLVLLAVLVPIGPGSELQIGAIGLALFAIGLGIGLCWPHLGTRVYLFARKGDQALAGASITTIVMVANAFGAAIGGMIANSAGLSSPGGVAGAQHASAWLFGVMALAPFAAAILARRPEIARARVDRTVS